MIRRSSGAIWNDDKHIFFAVDEDQDEVEEADESFLEMEELFHLKFGKKSNNHRPVVPMNVSYCSGRHRAPVHLMSLVENVPSICLEPSL